MRYLALLLILTSCAGPSTQQRWEAGRLSQVTAECLYTATYTASQEGRVSAAQMDQMDAAYAQWQGAQQRYLDAVRSRSRAVEAARQDARAALVTLLELVGTLAVF